MAAHFGSTAFGEGQIGSIPHRRRDERLKILIAGKDGQVGWELQRALSRLGDTIPFGQPDMDLSRPREIRDRVRDVSPQIIVNAAAYTAVDKAESDFDLAMAVNGVAPGVLAEEAQRLNAFLIHYSTDYVFDGSKTEPYLEDDPPNPLNAYGVTKLAGERAIQAVGARHVILRTSWVYGSRGHNFMLTMLRLARERDELRVIDDQIGAPTWCRAIAYSTARILEMQSQEDASDRMRNGIFNFTASGSTSWLGFAREIIECTTSERTRSPKLIPIPSEEYTSPAKRPKNSLLSSEKLRRSFGFSLEPWRTSLRTALSEYRSARKPSI